MHDEPLADASEAIAGMRIFAEKRAIAEIERLRAGEAARESESRIASIVRSATDGIIGYDATGQILLCNQSAASTLRGRIDEIVGMPIWRFSTPDGCQAMAAVIEQLDRSPGTRF